jgi:hypothetical protein
MKKNAAIRPVPVSSLKKKVAQVSTVEEAALDTNRSKSSMLEKSISHRSNDNDSQTRSA